MIINFRYIPRLLVAVPLIGAGLALGQGVPSSASLKIEIRPEPTAVNNTEQLTAHTRIINVSKETQELQIWTCSYADSWVSDSRAVTVVPVPWDKNALVPLKPGETYKRELFVHIAVEVNKLQQESVTFRLGFQPYANSDGLLVIWSNPLTVKILDAWKTYSS